MDTSPGAAILALTDPLRAYHDALDDGVSFADVTLRPPLPSCPWTWAHLARYLSAHRMVGAAVDQPWRVTKMQNNGIEVHSGSYTFRPLKAAQAGPPATGTNTRRRQYYSQFYMPTLFSVEEDHVNLLLDWNVSKNRHPELWLSKPVRPWRYGSKPDLAWRVPVRFPGAGQAAYVPPATDLDDDINVLPDIDEAEFGEGAE